MAADGSVVIEITGDDKKLESSLNGLGKKASGALKGVATAVTAATAAVGGLAAAAAKVGSEFEQSLAGTSTMFGDVAVDTDGLTQKILDLSSASGLAASDLSNSLYNALSAGIPVTEDMGEAMDYMESCTKLAAAGFTDIDTAVTATAKVMNAYGMTTDEVDKIQRIMLQTQNKGITTVNELGATLAQVTPTAAAMGVSFDQVGAALATMTAQGTPTAQATTQLNSLIAELGKNGTMAAMNLEKAAAGTKYAGKSFTQLMDEGVPLNEVLDLMGQYADSNGLSMIDMFSSIEAGKAALAMAGDNSAKFANNLEAMGTEADLVGDAYAKVTDTLDHKISVLKEGVSNLGIAIYQGMQEPLKGAAEAASGWLADITTSLQGGGVAGMAEAIFGIATNIIQTLGQGFADNIDQILQMGTNLLLNIISGLIESLPQLAMTAVHMLTSLALALVENIPVLVAAVPQIITGLLDAILATIPQIIKAGIELLTSLVSDLGTIITTIQEALPEIIKGVISTLAEHIPDIIQAGIDLLTALITNLPEIIGTIVTAIPEIISGIVEAFKESSDDIIGIGKDIITGVWEGIKSMGSWIKRKVSDFFGGVVDNVKGLLGIHSPSTVFAGIGKNTIAGYEKGIEAETSRATTKMTAAGLKLKNALADQLGSNLSELGAKARAAVSLETGHLATMAAVQSDSPSVIRETNTHTKTVERVARIEGDGVTDDLIRMLGLRLKDEDHRNGEEVE